MTRNVRRWAVMIGLVAALAGGPLRLTEAADDLSRALATQAGPDAMNEADGGVSDDPLVGLRDAEDPAPDDGCWAAIEPFHAPDLRFDARKSGRDLGPAPPDSPPRSSSRRRSLMQCFRF